MTKQKKIIIAVVAIGVIIAIIYFLGRKKANPTAKTTSQSPAFSLPSSESVPLAVQSEPPSDWVGEVLEYQGVKYTPVNGVWTKIKG